MSGFAMKWQDQTEFPERLPDGTVVRRGNCLMACLASIVGAPLESLPVLGDEHDDGSWYDVTRDAAVAHGFELVYAENSPNRFSPQGYHIANGPSPRGPWSHSVVAHHGEIVHDPHPSRAGVKEITSWLLLFPIARG